MAERVTMFCHDCAYLYVKQIHTSNAEEGVSGVYERYGCKKAVRLPESVMSRKQLKIQGCSFYKQEGTVLCVGDCFTIDGSDKGYIYLGTVGKHFKKYVVYCSTDRSYNIYNKEGLKGKSIKVYEYLPNYARKKKETLVRNTEKR